mmetsp:Transcript_235/g.816  ORF Transcript_235/g.816 Transcript_235/m.816 type:complete len:89 (-) Transcript_235:1199-1465(-)
MKRALNWGVLKPVSLTPRRTTGWEGDAGEAALGEAALGEAALGEALGEALDVPGRSEPSLDQSDRICTRFACVSEDRAVDGILMESSA